MLISRNVDFINNAIVIALSFALTAKINKEKHRRFFVLPKLISFNDDRMCELHITMNIGQATST